MRSESSPIPLVSFFIIATKNYVAYAQSLICSMTSCIDASLPTQIILLSDIDNPIAETVIFPTHITLSSHKIESLGWPEATLLRFDLMRRHKQFVLGKVVAYIDADMVVVDQLFGNDFTQVITGVESPGIALVEHPGYFSRSWLVRSIMRTRFGPWETRPKSAAFVASKDRSTYICGGMFWGERSSFFRMCDDIHIKICTDRTNLIRAKNNDESHLNNWFIANSIQLMSPEWVYAPGYRNLKSISPRISVIHKPRKFRRVPTDPIKI